MIHVTSEVLVIGGITYWLNSRITKLEERIKDLEKTVERLSSPNNRHEIHGYNDQSGPPRRMQSTGEIIHNSSNHNTSHHVAQGHSVRNNAMQNHAAPRHTAQTHTTQGVDTHRRQNDENARHTVDNEINVELISGDELPAEEVERLLQEELHLSGISRPTTVETVLYDESSSQIPLDGPKDEGLKKKSTYV